MIRNLALKPPDDTDVDKILAALETHIQGTTNSIVSTRQFLTRDQRENEPFSEWLLDLQDLARRCQFSSCCGECEQLRLRDQLVLGIKDEGTLKKLLQVGSTLTFDTAKGICEADEATARSRQALTQRAELCTTYKKNARHSKPPDKHSTSTAACKWCGGPGWHAQNRSKCRAHNSLYNKCRVKGHWGKVCKSKSGSDKSSKEAQSTRISTMIASMKLPGVAESTPTSQSE